MQYFRPYCFVYFERPFYTRFTVLEIRYLLSIHTSLNYNVSVEFDIIEPFFHSCPCTRIYS